MKVFRSFPTGWLLVAGLVVGLHFLHAQQTETPVPYGTASLAGTRVNYGGVTRSQTAAPGQIANGLRAKGENSRDGFIPALDSSTDSLWLQITNITNGMANLILNNATDQVYEVLSKTDLTLANWTIEPGEIWPTNSTAMPFTVMVLDRTNALFIRAADWTGVTENGNTVPDWWFWKYFGTLNLSDTSLDGEGNTLLSDYQSGLDPNTIQFLLNFTNDYVNSSIAYGTITIFSGTPSYMAVLVNDTNQEGAVWQPYNSTVVASLCAGDGNYSILVGLRGLPDDARQVWVGARLVLDTIPPIITITHPTTSIVGQPMIQLQGRASESLGSLTFDVSNAAGIWTNQAGHTTGQFCDTNLPESITNWFQCYDIALTGGLNIVTIHATDLAGNTTTTNTSFILDYSGVTNPPVLTVIWPQDGAQIAAGELTVNGVPSGANMFTLQATVDDATASVQATISDTSGNTNTVQALVERDGTVLAQNLPLENLTNMLTLTARNAAGYSSQKTLTVYRSDAIVALIPLSSDQLNRSSVNVSGFIINPDYGLTVNGVPATVNGDFTWTADDVPVKAGGAADFDIKVYDTDNNSIGLLKSRQLQPVMVELMSYSGRQSDDWISADFYNGNYYTGSIEDTVDWVYNAGGVYRYHATTTDLENPPVTDETCGLPPNEDGNLPHWGDSLLDPPWEQASVNVSPQGWLGVSHVSYGAHSWQNHTKTRVMIVPPANTTPGTTAFYLVRACATEFPYPTVANYFGNVDVNYGYLMVGGYEASYYTGSLPLPPAWLQINQRTLVNTGVTNDDGSFWGETIVQGPAGANVDVTPTIMRFHQYPDATFNVLAVGLNMQMAVDNNRDGNITFDSSDATSISNPYRFWVNDSQEHGDDESSEGEADDQIPGIAYNSVQQPAYPNFAHSQVQGRSDLVNFFPVALNLSNTLQLASPANGYEYHLYQADSRPLCGAVKFVYASLTLTNAFDYLINATATAGYGVNSDEPAYAANTISVNPDVILDTNWLAQIQNRGGVGIILLEGCAATPHPLMLEIWRNGKLLGGTPLYLSISGVEQMFRHANFCYVNGVVTVPARTDAPNEPANNGKNLVFLTGYNVNQQQARGVESEMFKRFYWSGSKARFYGVTWSGAVSQGDFIPNITANFQTNIVNALLTAPHFTSFLNALAGGTVVTAHSLGNMVVLSAISDYGVPIDKYFMIDSAVPIEAIDGGAETNADMIHPEWSDYESRLWATEWHHLFPNNDARNTLTWRDRLSNLNSVNDVYNFYSSGEEVLRDFPGAPPDTVGSSIAAIISEWWQGTSVASYVWVWQEKDKGRMQDNDFISSNHGGWKFNDVGYGTNFNGGTSSYWVHMLPDAAAQLLDSQLQTNAFFSLDSGVLFGIPVFTADDPLLGSDGSIYAQANRNRILSDAIPALTLPAGANAVTNLNTLAGSQRNFDMSSPDGIHFSAFQNGWPSARATGAEALKWHHSDFDYVAYPFTCKLFNQIVAVANLK